jgi:3-hydroxybutyryl-CoA dehydrogenase
MTLPYEFKTAAVIGTGMMGPGIALTLALGGVQSTILSRTAGGATLGLEKAQGHARFLADNGLLDAGEADRAAALLACSAEFDPVVAGVDLVMESGPEDMAWKQDLYARMDGLAGERTVLASNTSGLSITAIAARCQHPERVVTTHFWNPPHLMPLVEVVMGEKTSAAVAEAVRDLLARCGKTPVIVKKDRPGQLGNRLQMALVREAAYIIGEGIADVEDVDTVIKSGLGLRMPAYGTLEHMDVVGLDMSLGIAEYVARDLYNEPRAPEYYRNLVRNGNLGAKTGRGFYDWKTKSADEVKARRDRFLVEVLRGRRKERKQASGNPG